MVAIPFPLSSSPGERPQESAGRLINCYAEPLGQGARAKASYKRVPGLTSFSETTETTFRGMIEVGGSLYAVFDGTVLKITSAGVESTLDTLAGTDKVFLARNNNATPQIVAVSTEGTFTIDSDSVDDYPDADVGSPNSVCFLDGYFFFTYGDGKCRSSGINTTDIDSNDFVTAESNPDGLTRPIPFNGQLILFGTDSCEFWSGNPVNDTGFPFNRITSTPFGLAGKYAIAGHELGFGKDLLWVSKDNGVYHLKSGYQPEKVSPPDLDRLIAAVADKDDLEACVYSAAGRNVWVLSCDDWTWEFNLNSLKWNERQSYLIDRWRGTQSAYAFGKWLIGDTTSGNIYEIDVDATKEGTNPLRFRLESGPVHQFPNRTRIARIDVDVTTGVGVATGTDPIQTDPTIEISCARDCVNFDNPRLLKLGRQAIADQRVTATRFGLSGPQGMRWRIDVADPIYVGVLGANVSAELRVK